METESALLNSLYVNIYKNNIEKGINNERIKNKIELRHNEINNILFSKRKIKENNFVNKTEKKEINIETLKNLDVPNDFQINIFKYYESAIFL